jgi:three-Cys-motif partner protein
MGIRDRLPSLENDGLITPRVGDWGEEKYIRVWMYDQIFTQSMKRAWEKRVYIDLYAGAGRALLKTKGKIVPGSPLLALGVENRFDKYIFCEKNHRKLKALKERVEREAPGVDVAFVTGDVNTKIEEVLGHIPPQGALSFCFVDPYSLKIRFSTIQALAEGRPMDFMILLALGMDANRNLSRYVQQEWRNLDEFLGTEEWRGRWKHAQERGENFMLFLANEYIRAMTRIGYKHTNADRMYPVRSDLKNLPLYYLAFFSKHPLGYKFWDQVLKYSTEQRGLFD